MRGRPAHPTLWLVILLSLWGCSSLMPQKKESLNPPKIIEEDVAENRSAPPNGGTGPQTGSDGTSPPSGGMGDTVPPAMGNQAIGDVDPTNRPARRFIWRDKKGSGRSWQPAPDAIEAK
jgi:hypothetical protein